eukprot:TRINITY_DN50_c0_g1_i1.p4 TRINITY_DN50_c0_g1~~TRINITY_DN50_c0_g1_i1.p4  ORF type:complete len:367 (+),score=115.15 TRINITY_DN50_c0_g1_i1:2117-3217(+)
MRARVDVVFNAVSGTREPARDLCLVRRELALAFERVVVWHTTRENDAYELALRAIQDGATLLVACGGDGTVTAVASAMHHSDEQRLLLAVVPRGTANAFCSALHIPTDVRRAARMVARGDVRRVDFPMVCIDERKERMLLLAGVGLEARAVSGARRRMKRMFGALAYGICGIRSIYGQAHFHTDVLLKHVSDSHVFARGELQAEQVQLKSMVLKGVTIANAAPVTSVLAHGIGTIKPDDGLLELVCIAAQPPLRTLRTMLALLKSALLRARLPTSSVFGMRAREMHITCHPPQQVVVDGELVGYTPLSVKLAGSAPFVDVVAPSAQLVSRRRRQFTRALVRHARNVRGAALLAVVVAVLRRARTSA